MSEPNKHKKKKEQVTVRSSAAEYLNYVACVGDDEQQIEIRYEDENIWLTQKLMAILYGVEVHTVNYHIKKIFSDSELQENSVIRKFRITAADGKSYSTNHYSLEMIMEDWSKRLDLFLMADDREILQDAGKITAEIAKAKAETEFEKYRIVQDRLFMSDFDRYMLELENHIQK